MNSGGPGENGIGFRDASYLLEGQCDRSVCQSQRVWISRARKPHTDRKARSQDAVFGGGVFILEQQPLVHEAGDTGLKPTGKKSYQRR